MTLETTILLKIESIFHFYTIPSGIINIQKEFREKQSLSVYFGNSCVSLLEYLQYSYRQYIANYNYIKKYINHKIFYINFSTLNAIN